MYPNTYLWSLRSLHKSVALNAIENGQNQNSPYRTREMSQYYNNTLNSQNAPYYLNARLNFQSYPLNFITDAPGQHNVQANDFLKKQNHCLIARVNNKGNLSQFSNGYWNNGMNQLAYISTLKNVTTPNNQNAPFKYVRLNPHLYSLTGQSNFSAKIRENSIPLNSSSDSYSTKNLPFNPISISYGVETTPISSPILNDDNAKFSLHPSSFINENKGSSLQKVENMGIPFPIETSLVNNDCKANQLKTNSPYFPLFIEGQSEFSINKTENDGIKQNSSSSSTFNKKELVFSTENQMKDGKKSLNSANTVDNAQGNNDKNTDEPYIHAKVKIKLLLPNMLPNIDENSPYIDKNSHTIYYYIPKKKGNMNEKVDNSKKKDKPIKFIDCTLNKNDGKNEKVNNNKEINESIDYGSILKVFPGVNNVKVDYDGGKKEGTKVYNLKEKGNKSNTIILPIETNCNSRNQVTYLSFSDEKYERFKTSIELRDLTTKRRHVKDKLKKLKVENNENDKDMSNQDRIKIEIINGFIENIRKANNNGEIKNFLDISIRFGLKEILEKILKETLRMAIKKKIFKEEENETVEDAIKEFLRNPNKETHEILRKNIFNKVKDEKKEKELLILCFDALYKFIFNMDENVRTCMIYCLNNKIYENFLKEYSPFIGEQRDNYIIVTMNDIDRDVMETKNHCINCQSGDCKRRYDSASGNGEPQRIKQRKIEDGNITRLIDK